MHFFGTKVISIYPKMRFAFLHNRSKKALFLLKNSRILNLSFSLKITTCLYFKSINLMNKNNISN